jgi:hypothetical protein
MGSGRIQEMQKASKRVKWEPYRDIHDSRGLGRGNVFKHPSKNIFAFTIWPRDSNQTEADLPEEGCKTFTSLQNLSYGITEAGYSGFTISKY